jgi:hypothetical protein
MTARVKRQAVLVLTWIIVTTSATAMAWWSVTFVTAAVGDRRPLRPSDVVAAAVGQVVAVPAWADGDPQPIGTPGERTVRPVTAVVVEAVAAAPIQAASPTAPASTSGRPHPSVVPGSRLIARPSPVSTASPVTVTVQVASAPQVSAKLSAPVVPVPAPRSPEVVDLTVASVVPVPAPRSPEVADLTVASAAGLVAPAGSSTTVAVIPVWSHDEHNGRHHGCAEASFDRLGAARGSQLPG